MYRAVGELGKTQAGRAKEAKAGRADRADRAKDEDANKHGRRGDHDSQAGRSPATDGTVVIDDGEMSGVREIVRPTGERVRWVRVADPPSCFAADRRIKQREQERRQRR